MSVVLSELLTVPEMQRLVGQRLKALRLQLGYRRSTLALRAGVSESSLKRLETTGQASLANTLRTAQALGRLRDVAELFKLPEPASLSEMEARIPHERGKI